MTSPKVIGRGRDETFEIFSGKSFSALEIIPSTVLPEFGVLPHRAS